MSQRIIISVINDLECDQRVHRICQTLYENDYEVILVGRITKKSTQVLRPYSTRRFQLLFDTGFLFYAEFNLRLFIYLLIQKKDLLYANDLDTLMPNFLVSKFSSVPLIYDSHEYFTEVPELIGRPRVKKIWLSFEKAIFPKLRNVITVNQKLAEEYNSKYGVPIHVIKNVPRPEINGKFFEAQKGCKQNLIIYQGALNLGRGIEIMIESMSFLSDFNLLLVGSGDMERELKNKVKCLKLKKQIQFLGRVPFEVLPEYTKQASIGLSLEEDLGLNYRYALPNKLFDYIHSGIPVIVSDLPLMKKFVKDNRVGEVLAQRNPKELALLIRQVVEDKNFYRPHLKNTAAHYHWNNEKKKFLKIVNNLE